MCIRDSSGVSAVPVGVGFKQRLDSFFPDQQAVLFDNGIFCEYFENSFVALHGVIDVYFDIGHSSVIESVSATLPVVVEMCIRDSRNTPYNGLTYAGTTL